VTFNVTFQDVPQSASNVYQRSVSCYSKAGYCVKQGVVVSINLCSLVAVFIVNCRFIVILIKKIW